MSIPDNTKKTLRAVIVALAKSSMDSPVGDDPSLDVEHFELRHLIAANLAYVNKCAVDIDSDPRTIAGLMSLPIHQLAYLAGLTGESRWRVHADALNEQKFALLDRWSSAVTTTK